MKLLGLNFPFRRTAPAVTERSAPLIPLEWLRGEELSSGPHLSSAYEQVVWVYRAINVLAEQVANVPFLFSTGERGRESLITSGPLHDFYNRPHPQINRFQYWELRIIWLMLRGECFRIPIFEDSALKRVLILDPAHFQPLIEDHQLLGWRYTGLGPRAPLASQVLLPEEVWFEKLPNPFDFWRGLSPLSVAAMAAKTDFAAGAFMRGLIENNADTGLIVRSEQQLGPEQRAQIQAALRERKRRAGAADKAVLLWGCNEIVQPKLSSSDLQFLQNRQFARSEICAAFGVPEEILTATDHAKYDVMEGARLNFIENRIAPLCRRLAAEEQATVRSLDPQAAGWFDLESLPILQQARRSRLAAARTGFEMGIPFNELNRVFDLGFQPLPWGDRGYVAGGLQPVQGVRNAECGVRNGRSHVGDLLQRAEQLFSSLEKPLGRKLQRFFFEQRQRVLARIGENNPTSPILDLPAEDQHLSEALNLTPVEAHRINLETLAQLDHALKMAHSPEQQQHAVRTVFNHAANHRIKNMILPKK